MTSKLKCPVCQQELGIILCDTDDFVCSKCRMCGSEKLWTALIQAKQDLKIAIETLKHYEMAGSFDHNGEYKLDLREMTEAHKALEQIEHKE